MFLKNFIQKYLKNTIIGCLTVVLDKEKFKNIHMPILRSSHDMALWLDLLKEEEFAFGIQQELVIYENINHQIHLISLELYMMFGMFIEIMKDLICYIAYIILFFMLLMHLKRE